MIFTETPLRGAYLVAPELREDDRGAFARVFCQDEMRDHGLEPVIAQANVSVNHRAGTLRGMHYQVPPHDEAKLVRCTRGAIFDVIVDLRPESPTHLQPFGARLDEDDRLALYVPPMFAHGYQALTDRAEVTYLVSAPYAPGAERGLAHDDPALGIDWPMPVTDISDKDATWPRIDPDAGGRLP